jgi:hypothetical protein
VRGSWRPHHDLTSTQHRTPPLKPTSLGSPVESAVIVQHGQQHAARSTPARGRRRRGGLTAAVIAATSLLQLAQRELAVVLAQANSECWKVDDGQDLASTPQQSLHENGLKRAVASTMEWTCAARACMSRAVVRNVQMSTYCRAGCVVTFSDSTVAQGRSTSTHARTTRHAEARRPRCVYRPVRYNVG